MRKRMVASLASAALLLIAVVARPALAETFHTVKGLLAQQFSRADRVTYEKIELNDRQLQVVAKELGAGLNKRDWTFYRADKNGSPIGYALFDREKGQHEMMDLATFLDPGGNVTRVELVSFREPYGDGVKSPRFRQQFVGKGRSSGFEAGRDIDIISGATISSRALARAVKRAVVVFAVAKTPASSSPTPASTQ